MASRPLCYFQVVCQPAGRLRAKSYGTTTSADIATSDKAVIVGRDAGRLGWAGGEMAEHNPEPAGEYHQTAQHGAFASVAQPSPKTCRAPAHTATLVIAGFGYV